MPTNKFTRNHIPVSTLQSSPAEFAAFGKIIQRLQNTEFTVDRERIKEYFNYSRELKTIVRLSELHQQLDKMLNQGLFPNTTIINQCIKMLGNGFIDDAYSMYHIAVKKNLADKITFASHYSGNTPYFDLRKRIA